MGTGGYMMIENDELDFFFFDSDFRQDMGGVGGFSTTNKTLYIGRITNVSESVVRKHFGLWGEIARIHILRQRGVAFVDYKSRASAEFAKEAMMNQSLDNKETINVR
jgi:RNA recognition motif-containing protein